MTKLEREVRRVSRGTVFERGQDRPVVVTLAPPNLIGFRLAKTRRTYWLTTECGYELALKAAVLATKRERDKAKPQGRRQVRRGVL